MASSTVTMDDDVLYEVVAALVEWRNREPSRLEDDEDVGEFIHELLAPLLNQRDRARATAVHLEQELFDVGKSILSIQEWYSKSGIQSDFSNVVEALAQLLNGWHFRGNAECLVNFRPDEDMSHARCVALADEYPFLGDYLGVKACDVATARAE